MFISQIRAIGLAALVMFAIGLTGCDNPAAVEAKQLRQELNKQIKLTGQAEGKVDALSEQNRRTAQELSLATEKIGLLTAQIDRERDSKLAERKAKWTERAAKNQARLIAKQREDAMIKATSSTTGRTPQGDLPFLFVIQKDFSFYFVILTTK